MFVLITRCGCGAELSIPVVDGPLQAQCPKCQETLAVKAPTIEAGPHECPICQTTLEVGAQSAACGACGLLHHTECWQEVGGCGAYGCSNTPAKPDSDRPPEPPRHAWGDTKACPICQETIKSIAVKCRYCGAELGDVNPQTSDEYFKNKDAKTADAGFRGRMGVIFGLSFIGLLAPLMLVIALVIVLAQRDRLQRAGPLYVTLGYASIGISAVYSILMLAFALMR